MSMATARMAPPSAYSPSASPDTPRTRWVYALIQSETAGVDPTHPRCGVIVSGAASSVSGICASGFTWMRVYRRPKRQERGSIASIYTPSATSRPAHASTAEPLILT